MEGISKKFRKYSMMDKRKITGPMQGKVYHIFFCRIRFFQVSFTLLMRFMVPYYTLDNRLEDYIIIRSDFKLLSITVCILIGDYIRCLVLISKMSKRSYISPIRTWTSRLQLECESHLCVVIENYFV